MPRKARKPKARLSQDEWFVYMVRCADGSLYTGTARRPWWKYTAERKRLLAVRSAADRQV